MTSVERYTQRNVTYASVPLMLRRVTLVTLAAQWPWRGWTAALTVHVGSCSVSKPDHWRRSDSRTVVTRWLPIIECVRRTLPVGRSCSMVVTFGVPCRSPSTFALCRWTATCPAETHVHRRIVTMSAVKRASVQWWIDDQYFVIFTARRILHANAVISSCDSSVCLSHSWGQSFVKTSEHIVTFFSFSRLILSFLIVYSHQPNTFAKFRRSRVNAFANKWLFVVNDLFLSPGGSSKKRPRDVT